MLTPRDPIIPQATRKLWLAFILALFVGITMPLQSASAQAPYTIDVGYRGPSYPSGGGGNNQITESKPQSKLWWNDGYWWAAMWSNSGDAYHIHQLDLATQTWIDTGTVMDDRLDSKGDALWDGEYLYFVSQIFSLSGSSSSSGKRGELYRYSYNPANDTYSLSSGFPIEVNQAKGESIVIEKDGAGQLWVTWVENRKVMVNYTEQSGGSYDDTQWAGPTELADFIGSAANVSSDDVSSIVHYDGHTGIMWSNQSGGVRMYFAVHKDGDPANAWQEVTAYNTSGDDHISLKGLQSDASGKVFAAVKTDRSSDLIVLLVCDSGDCSRAGDWESHTVYNSSGTPTRPLLMLDTTNRKVYVFARVRASGRNGDIYYKSTSMDNIRFESGLGEPFIASDSDLRINDPSSTKQSVNSTTGLVIIASDESSRDYFHNYDDLGGHVGAPPVAEFSVDQRQGSAPHAVQFTDETTNNPTSWLWDFGDGNQSTEQNPNHTYTEAGAYTVRLTATNNEGSDEERKTNHITVSAPAAPTADFLADTTSGTAPLNVNFADQSTGNPENWLWDFGDGNQSTEQHPSHTYGEAGSYTVSLTVSNAQGNDSKTMAEYIAVDGPVGDQTFTPIEDTYTRVGRTNNYGDSARIRIRSGSSQYHPYLKFDVTGIAANVQKATLRLYVVDATSDGGDVYLVSNDGNDGNPWLEDGLNDTNAPAIGNLPLDSVGATTVDEWVELDVTAVIKGNGTYSFALANQSTNSGYYSSKEGAYPPELVIETSDAPPASAPTADFTADTRSGQAPHSVNFSDQSTDNPTSWLWDFGDGTQSTEQHPNHVYENDGVYTVSLEVTNGQGSDTLTQNDYITVSATPPPPPTAGQIFMPTDDSYIRVGRTNNYGNSNQMRVRDGSSSYHTLIKFDVTGVAAGQQATLRLYVVDGSKDGGDVFLVSNNDSSGNPWQEETVNGSNTPIIDSDAVGATGEIDKDSWVEVDITAVIDGDGTYSFALASQSTNSAYYSTKEGSHPPELVFSGEGNPETAPTAAFSADNPEGNAPHSVSFTDQSRGNPTSWLWDFGDGNQSTAQNPSHTYDTAGQYSVSLQVTNAHGDDTHSESNYITVHAGPPPPPPPPGDGQTFAPTDDVFIRLGRDRNYGDEPYLRLRSGSSSYHSFLKFEVTNAGSVQQATLRLYVIDGSNDGGELFMVENNLKNSSLPWAEDSVASDNAPDVSGTAVTSIGSIDSDSWVEIDVTSVINGDGIYSFGLYSQSSNSAYYSSKEGSHPPELVINAP